MNKSCPIFIGTGVKPNGFVCSECKKSIYSYNNNSVSEKIVICDDDIYGKTRFIVSDIATNIFEIANDKNLKYADVDDTDLCMRVMFGKYSKGWFVCKLTYNPYNDAELAFNTFKNKQHAWNFIDEDSRKILTIQHLKNTGYNPIFYDSNANNKIKYQ
jgi:hypothetical protein